MRKRVIAACLAAVTTLGCGSRENDQNLSIRAGEDPARLQRAEAEVEAAAARARQAEARKTKGVPLVNEP